MNDCWVLFDMSGLAYRAFYSMRGLTYEGVPTAVTFGVLRDVLYFRDLFQPSQFLFCFDVGPSKRKEIYPDYKENRSTPSDPEQAAMRKAVHGHLRVLMDDVLPELGYANIVGLHGYESDDLMAAVCGKYTQQAMVIVSADHDMYQCLTEHVSIWQPNKKKMVTRQSFTDEWGIGPSQWADVLALSGCSTDNVKGIKGVGEKTAVRFLSGSLTSGKVFDSIVANSKLWQSNLELVRLPFQKTPAWKIKEDSVTGKKWQQTLRRFGITSLRY